jgi:hypothetical protein
VQPNSPRGRMSEYDARVWDALVEREQRTGRQVVPDGMRDRLRRGGEAAKGRFDAIPGFDTLGSLLLNSVGGLTDLGSRAARASVRTQAVVRAYQKRGYAVEEIEDVRRLELRDMDQVKPRLDLVYVTASTAQGAVTGLAVSGGQVVTLGTTVPGAGLLIGAMVADAAGVLLTSQRAVAHVAAYYGYDVRRDEEKLFALGVMGLGTASEVGKVRAYVELNRVVQGLARKQTWSQLRESVVTRVVEKVYARLGMRLTQRKLGQAVPVIGVVIGAGLNARMLAQVVDDAEHAYRKRHLQEKYGIVAELPETTVVAERDDTISVADIVDAEIVEAEIVTESDLAPRLGADEALDHVRRRTDAPHRQGPEQLDR